MKMTLLRNLTFSTIFLLCMAMQAQVTIGDGAPPQSFSTLEIVSNGTGGLRLPHLTTAERDALQSSTGFQDQDHRGGSVNTPGLALGLTIYNTDTNCSEYWNGYKWVSLCLGTANIILRSPCGDYNPLNPPLAQSDGKGSVCKYTPEDTPACIVSSGKAFDVYLIAGSAYASIVVDQLTSAFTINFQPNNSNSKRNAVVRVVNNCTGEFKDFVFGQEGAVCPSVPDPQLNSNNLSLCAGGSVFAHVTNAQPGTDYIWTFSGVTVHTGNWYEIKRSGTYEVYAGLLGCGKATTLTVTDNNNIAPSLIDITATNGGILCSGGTVLLSAATTQTVLWYQNGIPLDGKDKNKNPLPLSGASAAGQWFAAVQDGECVSNSSNVVTLIDNTASGSTALLQPQAQVNGQLLSGSSLTICKEGTLKLEVTNVANYPPGTEYEWFNNGVSIGKGATIIYTVPAYTSDIVLSVTVTDNGSSCPNTAVSQNTTVTLTAPGITSINSGAMQAAICGTTKATLTADYGGAPAYEWFFNGLANGETASSIQVGETGTYTVRYKDDNGCWSQVSTGIKVIQSSMISMSWYIEPTDVKKGESHTYEVNSDAAKYEWSYSSALAGAVTSITPIDGGKRVVVQYGTPSVLPCEVIITVKSVGHPCGDAVLNKTIKITSGCSKLQSVLLTPTGIITLSEDETRTFTAVAGTNSGDEQYEWFLDGVLKKGPSTDNTYMFTAGNEGDYTVSVRAINSCTTSADNITAAATVHVNPDLGDYTDEDHTYYVLTGKNCYDVAQSNFTTTCGTEDQRPGDFLDPKRKWLENKFFEYALVDDNDQTSDLKFVLEDPSALIDSSYQSSRKKFKVRFKEAVLESAKGRDKNSPLTFTIYALYKRNDAQRKRKLIVKVQDCRCDCSAKVFGVMRAFKCHNEGADETLDPLKPAKGLHGAKYQFGVNSPTLSMAVDQSNSGVISGWNTNDDIRPNWSSTSAVCPTGYRVPTAAEWQSVIDSNTKTYVGSWNNQGYTNGIRFGTDLFLPAAGFRNCGNGSLNYLGWNANYWSGTYKVNYGAMCLDVHNADMVNQFQVVGVSPTYAFPVRCISNN